MQHDVAACSSMLLTDILPPVDSSRLQPDILADIEAAANSAANLASNSEANSAANLAANSEANSAANSAANQATKSETNQTPGGRVTFFHFKGNVTCMFHFFIYVGYFLLTKISHLF
jgi:hypothetical protein